MLDRANPLERENQRLRERVEELEETVRQLQEDGVPEPLPAGLPYLTKSEETILRALLSRRGRVVPRTVLYEDLYPRGEDRDPQIVVVMVSRLRAKLDGLVDIKTEHGRGYAASLIVPEAA
jgi:DNA-binding response OmpR family regulator